MIVGWAWEGTAPGIAACGVSDQEDRARLAAEKWLEDNPGAVAVLGAARLADGTGRWPVGRAGAPGCGSRRPPGSAVPPPARWGSACRGNWPRAGARPG